MFCVTCMGQVAYSSLFLILDTSCLVVSNHPHSERLTGPPPALPHRVGSQLQVPITERVFPADRTAGLRKGRGKNKSGGKGRDGWMKCIQITNPGRWGLRPRLLLRSLAMGPEWGQYQR
jgi:hypothetical protein